MADALQLLREDHMKVKELFRHFDDADSPAEKKRIADQALNELDVHARIEEEIFYPAVRRESDAEELLLEEAVEEHDVAKQLIDELRRMPRVDTQYEAKFMVLAESVKHHIQEEESEILPKAAEVGMDRMRQLGETMGARKQELMQEVMTMAPSASPNGRKAASPRTARRRTVATAVGIAGARKARARSTGSRTAGGRATRTRSTSGRSTRGSNGRRRTTRTGAMATRRSTTRTTGTRRRTTGGRTTARRTTARRTTARGTGSTTRRATRRSTTGTARRSTATATRRRATTRRTARAASGSRSSATRSMARKRTTAGRSTRSTASRKTATRRSPARRKRSPSPTM